MERCIILNGDYSYLNVVSWKRAICLMIKGKAEVLKYSDKSVIRNVEGEEVMRVPLVMRLIKIIRMIYKNKVPYSKRNIFIRDNFRCVYCGARNERLTVDHVIPQGQGGKSSFDNCVAACKPCNHKKGNRTPTEAKMFMRKRPYSPTIYEFIRLKMKHYKIDDFLKELGVY